MAETQEARDKKMRGIRSNRANESKIRGISLAREMIWDLEHYGPTGLIHIAILNGIIGKSIRIWNADGSLNRIIGEEVEQPIDVEYHTIDSESIGHWTLRHAKDPSNTEIDLNSCLFSVIGSQTGQTPVVLRRWTVLKLKNKLRQLADRLDEILQLEESDGRVAEWLMIGGARYIGTSPTDAARILDNSQNRYSHRSRNVGHPRGHASDHWAATYHGIGDSIEAYSTRSYKTGFMSRHDQDLIAHLALTSRAAQDAMNYFLNAGSETEKVIISAISLRNNLINHLPQAVTYCNGQQIGPPEDFIAVILILRHHCNQLYNSDADVFVQTLYPII